MPFKAAALQPLMGRAVRPGRCQEDHGKRRPMHLRIAAGRLRPPDGRIQWFTSSRRPSPRIARTADRPYIYISAPLFAEGVEVGNRMIHALPTSIENEESITCPQLVRQPHFEIWSCLCW